MEPEQHRRLCGNDIGMLSSLDLSSLTREGVVIFYDSDAVDDTYTPFEASAMGHVPHVFTVIQPHPTANETYRYMGSMLITVLTH